MRGSYRKKSPRELPPVYCAPTAAAVIRLITRQNALDPRLAPTDRHMQRWAAGQGTGLPNPERALILRASLTPLPSIDAIITDKVVLDSPSYWRRFIVLWYRSDCSVDQMAQDMSLSRDKVFIERRLVLAYLLGRLTALGILIPTFEPYA